ncbi:hypothetical protein [Beijerinckia sp. L45]|uniref:hypothetical protein n=1 Tax=Beijerinckia sp. L45 TaxID=1641855 RepID=UPI00131D80BB|nr:hypothetical protein [Beijerinckia sp. L45]
MRPGSLTDLLLRHLGEQNDILFQIREAETPAEYLRIRDMIGRTMGAISADALRPIFAEHPDLKPDYLR